MKRNSLKAFIMAGIAILLFFASCGNNSSFTRLEGTWGCETYISMRTNADGTPKYDTINYEVGEGKGYELYFKERRARLTINDADFPIHTVSFRYHYNAEQQSMVFEGLAWRIAIYGSDFFHNISDNIPFHIDLINDSMIWASWQNNFSEPEPFYEWFHLKKID